MGILLTLYTGIRIGELCALQWKNIDMKNQTIHIEKTIQRISVDSSEQSTKIIFDTPKSSTSIRNIPIFTNLFHILKNSFYNLIQMFYIYQSLPQSIGHKYWPTNSNFYVIHKVVVLYHYVHTLITHQSILTTIESQFSIFFSIHHTLFAN